MIKKIYKVKLFPKKKKKRKKTTLRGLSPDRLSPPSNCKRDLAVVINSKLLIEISLS